MDALHTAGIAAPRITVSTTSSNLRGELLATGRYLTMVPRFWVLLPRRNRSLRVLLLEFPNTRANVASITLKHRSLSRATELFIESVRALTKPLAGKIANCAWPTFALLLTRNVCPLLAHSERVDRINFSVRNQSAADVGEFPVMEKGRGSVPACGVSAAGTEAPNWLRRRRGPLAASSR
jgi:hypothetical protein